MAFAALSNESDQALRDNLAILQKHTQFKVPGIDVPVQVDLPELNAPTGQVAVAARQLGKYGNVPIPPTSRIGAAVVRAALQFRGVPYKWGGEDPNTGFDCSGLVQYVFKKYGVNVPRVTYEQFRSGTPVPLNSMRPGDLVFFHPSAQGPGHVGIFIGNGKYLQAPQTGDVVKISNLSDRTDLLGVRRFG